MKNITSLLTDADISKLVSHYKSIEDKEAKYNNALFQTLNCDSTLSAFKSDIKGYDDELCIYDEDNGLYDRGGFMKMLPSDMLRFHVPNFKQRLQLTKELIDYNDWGFSAFSSNGIGKRGYIEDREGGTNIPIAFNCQILLSIIIINLYHDWKLQGIQMVMLSI